MNPSSLSSPLLQSLDKTLFSFRLGGKPAILNPVGDPGPERLTVEGIPLEVESRVEVDPERRVLRWQPVLRFGTPASGRSLPRVDRVRLAEIRLENADPDGATRFRSVRGGTCQHGAHSRFPSQMFRIEDRDLYAHDIFRYYDDTGRGSNEYLPIWLFEEASHGFWLAPEWSGSWSLEVHRLPAYSSVLFSLPQLDFIPRPEETIELPAVTLGLFEGDLQDGANHFRRYAGEVCIPPFGGKRAHPRPMFQIFGGPRENMGEPKVHQEVEAVAALGMETFTYPSTWQYDNDPEHKLQWWNLMGGYTPAKTRFPEGMDALRDHLEEKGMDLGLWIDPRVGLDSPCVNDPGIREHLLFYPETFDRETTAKYDPISYDINIQPLFDLGREGGRNLFAQHLDRMVDGYGAKMVWFDMNCDPRPFFFDPNESPDRRGLLELNFYQGFDRVMAEFREKHPGVWIEICASGGRMISLASIKAGHSHWITDYTGDDPDIAGAILIGANSILPTVCNHQSWYLPDPPASGEDVPSLDGFLANFPADLSFAPEMAARSEFCRNRIKERVDFWKAHASLLNGDFYPLLHQASDRTGVDAWQMHVPELGEGLVCVRYLRESDPTQPISLRMRGLGSSESVTLTESLGDASVSFHADQAEVRVNSGRAYLFRYRSGTK